MKDDATLAAVDLNMLRALDVLLDTASVAASAERLGVTPAAASNALRRLRDHFGDPLLVRIGARLQRTAVGERLRGPAADGMRAVARALVVGPSFDPARAAGEVSVSTSDHVDAVWLEPLRRRFEEEAPRVEVLLVPYTNEAPRRALEGGIDLVVAPRTRFTETLRVSHLADEPFALAMRRSHPRARHRLDAELFSELSHLVVSPTGDSAATAVDRSLAALGLRRRIVRRVTSFSSGLLAVATSDLVVVVPRSFASLHASRLGLRLREVPFHVPPARLDLAWSPRVHDEPLHTFVRQRLLELARARPRERGSAP
ncbi:MAG: LysR family transcriptional regulator [Myxococcales bacterium]|nr:LysR family transcriptional regulator [Myxococcales bacterium]